MNRLILILLVVLGHYNQANEVIFQKALNNISQFSNQLKLITNGEQAPQLSQDGLIFYLGDSKTCADNACTKMIVQMQTSSVDNCLKEVRNQAIGTLPFAIENHKAYLTIWNIADKMSKAKDNYTYHKQGICTEISYGYNGRNFEVVKKLIQKLY